MSEGELSRVRLKDVELTPVGRSNTKISLGDLWGNRFKITIRDIALPVDETLDRVKNTTGN